MSLEKESSLLTSAIIKLIILFDWQKPFLLHRNGGMLNTYK